MESNIEYIKLFLEYTSDDMPVIFFYEVDLDDDRYTFREMEVFINREVKRFDDSHQEVIEECPVPTVDELNAGIWGKGLYAIEISKEEFNEIWESGIYSGSLTTL